jgi:hypothetical protein
MSRRATSVRPYLLVWLHNGRDEDAVRVFRLELLELRQHDFERAVGDQLDVLPPDHLLSVLSLKLGAQVEIESKVCELVSTFKLHTLQSSTVNPGVNLHRLKERAASAYIRGQQAFEMGPVPAPPYLELGVARRDVVNVVCLQ